MKLLDEETAKKLNFTRTLSLLKLSCDFTSQILPIDEFLSTIELTTQYDNIESCLVVIKNEKLYAKLIGIFHEFKNIKATIEHIENSVSLDETELFEIKNFSFFCSSLLSQPLPDLIGIDIEDLSDVYKLLDPEKSGTTAFCIYNSFSKELENIRKEKEKIEKKVYIVKSYERDKLMIKFSALSEKENGEELKVCKELTRKLSKYSKSLKNNLFAVAKLDFTLAKARLAVDYNMTRPKLLKHNTIEMVSGFHPIVKYEVEKRHGQFYDVSICCKRGTTVITGANMGGKTVSLSTIALNYVFASMGFFSFSEKFSFFPSGPVAFISDTTGSVENGLSSFGTEVISLKKVLEKVKMGEVGLVIIDEFSRGTNPSEGSCLVKALVNFLNTKNVVSIMTTHYDGVSSYAKVHYQVKGLKNVDFKRIDLASKSYNEYISVISEHMDYTLEKVEIEKVPKDAFNICSFFGIDEEILNEAKKFMHEKL